MQGAKPLRRQRNLAVAGGIAAAAFFALALLPAVRLPLIVSGRTASELLPYLEWNPGSVGFLVASAVCGGIAARHLIETMLGYIRRTRAAHASRITRLGHEPPQEKVGKDGAPR